MAKRTQPSELSAAQFLAETGTEKPKKRANQPERIMQKQCVRWFRRQYSVIRFLLWATPNAAKRTFFEQKQVEDEGIVSGVPDLTLAIPRGGWHGLYMELKILPNQPTDDQRFMLDQLYKQGYMVQVVYTFEQFQTLVNAYLRLPIVPMQRYSLSL